MFRKDLIDMLLHNPMSIRDIARALELSPRDVEQDIRHLLKSGAVPKMWVHLPG
jgi:predicted transcriptional regulator